MSSSVSKSSSNNLEVAASVIAYSLCSGTLVLLNKLILAHYNYPSLVICVQLVATLAFIWTAKYTRSLPVDDLEWKYIVPYLYYIIAFALGVYCNMKSLSLSNVETVIVFRALSPCVVAWLDVWFLGREYPNLRSWMALATIVIGAYGYASFDPKFQEQGWSAYAWPLMYLAMISFEMCYGKKIIRSVDLKTLSGPVLYTNFLGIFPMLMFAAMGDEFQQLQTDWIQNREQMMSVAGLSFMVLGCVAGTAIGYSAWWCRDKVSATSFTLIGVLNKCLTILLNVMIWDQHAPPGGILCLTLCLAGGAFYQQAPMRAVGSKESKPLLADGEDDQANDPENGPLGHDDDVDGGETKLAGSEGKSEELAAVKRRVG